VVGVGAFVALGDSFTEGVGDPYPGGSCQGWAGQRNAVATHWGHFS
jgi:hypothetical protein